ncbi:MAG: type I-C CRISPR-associated protein Cas5c [Bifidobacteriaceae bacterium]|nr:type I-C CRISPR-associated protein Cas5c [Bifidobacteriaceae bacterium]
MIDTSIEYEVSGRYALFSDPITRIGGEKLSYQVPTYQALKGITESIYWKPTFVWIIDRVRVMNRIQTEGKGIRPIKFKGGNDLSYYTYLKDVRYRIKAHFEWNTNRSDLDPDRSAKKHLAIAQRSIDKGGRRDIFLGTRECQGYVERCDTSEDGNKGFYDEYGELDLGYMFYGFSYPDENANGDFIQEFWHPVMKDGIIEFPRPDSEVLNSRVIRSKQRIKHFELGKSLNGEEE